MPQLIEARDLPMVPRLIGLVGSQGQGKTTCALTISEGYATGDCKDTALLAFDLDATVGPQSRGINVPTYQLAGINDWTVMESEIKDIVKQLTQRVKDKVTKNVIFDTVSLLDSLLLTYFQSRTPDNFALYARVAQWHRWFLMEQMMPLTVFGARLIAVFQPHYKEINVEDKKAAEKKAIQQQRNAADGIEPEADKHLAISGKIAAKLYRTQCSLIMPVVRTKAPGGKYDFWLYPNGGGLGFETKNRYSSVLAEKEPADLLKLYNKIANHKVAA